MGAFSVALSGWALATVTGLVAGPAGGEGGFSASASLEAPSDGIEVDSPAQTVAGFRMEGSPEIEVVFGDSRRYRAHVDRFYALHERMQQSRADFGRSVQRALRALEGKRHCPAAELAPIYYRADASGDRFRADGAALEREYVAVRTLDQLGETAGLTPDYRWKVNKIRGIYRSALADYKEMRVAFIDQLGAELRTRGCDLERLVELGRKAPAPPSPSAESDEGPEEPADRPDETVPANTVTFFIDNQACSEPVDVYLDGTLLGEAEGGTKAAFQALAGRHMLCLIDRSTGGQCGDPGTVRTAFVFDGWSVTLHCAE